MPGEISEGNVMGARISFCRPFVKERYELSLCRSGLRTEDSDGAFGRVCECVSHERVVARLAEPSLENHPAADGDVDRLYAFQRVLERSILENPLEDSAYHVKR